MNAQTENLTSNKLEDIRAAMRALEDAKAIRCICTGFVIQYEGGCCCAHGKAVKLAEDNLKQILEAL